MRKFRKLLVGFIFLSLSLFILSSCNLISSKTNTESTDITGSTGLTINLPKIPSQLNVGQGMEIPIVLENTGKYNIENAMLVISGYDPNHIKFSSPVKYEGINLEGKTEFVPTGEKTTQIFTISSVSLPDAKETKEIFNVLACYPYKTEASPMVCINPQWAFGGSSQGCTYSEAKVAATQGAPLAVAKVVTNYFSSKKEVRFDIYAKDASGKGSVLAPDSYGKPCLGTEALTEDDLGVVLIEAYLSGEKLKCYDPASGENAAETDRFTLLTSTETLAAICTATINYNQPAYTTPLSVYMTYGYANGKTFSVTIKNPSYIG